ncbi:MAG TPA: DUF4410 domain-containing protein [Gammaproteobacteria bacterium]|nr:DUF4410 domain-containing protein [Gammaproteobacteria bacterium]
MIRNILLISSMMLLLGACSSGVKMKESAAPYKYSGEKYGIVTVTMSEGVTKDERKAVRTDQLKLDANIQSYLTGRGIYDSTSKNRIEVLVNKIHIRNTFNAVMFGFMSGSDNIAGTVSLKDADGRELSSFDITASYALGGGGGGQDDARLGWLSEQFAKLTVDSIMGTQKNKRHRKTASR